MDKDEHVYCTDCEYGEELIDAILNDKSISFICSTCYPYDPEDSRTFELRQNYVPKNEWAYSDYRFCRDTEDENNE